MPSRLIASSLALIAFAAAIIAGILANNPAATTLWRALVAMFLCYLVGSALGAIAQKILHEHIDQYKRDHPIEGESETPTRDQGSGTSTAAADASHDAPLDKTSPNEQQAA